MKTLNKAIFVIMLVMVVSITLITTLNDYLTHRIAAPFVFALKEVMYVAFIFGLIALIILRIHLHIEKKIAWKGNIARKLLLTFGAYFGVTNLLIVAWVFGLNTYIHYGNISQQLFKNLVIANIVSSMMYLVMEVFFILREWTTAQVHNERLQKENALAQLETLKSHINPHFLFNCLNTLNSLLYVSVPKSSEFIHHFSLIYRYVLEVREQLVVPVKQELEFARSYFHLHKIQYENKIQLNIQLGQKLLDRFIPPLSFQLLLENAIKHNTIGCNAPLIITIEATDAYIIVKNNYQPRHDSVVTTGLGLSHLIKRYEMLSAAVPEYGVINDSFVVKLPYIATD